MTEDVDIYIYMYSLRTEKPSSVAVAQRREIRARRIHIHGCGADDDRGVSSERNHIVAIYIYKNASRSVARGSFS